MYKLIEKTHIGLKWILIILLTVMVIDVSLQVFSRYILQQSSSVTEELATFLLIWVGLLGAAYAYREKARLGIDLISDRLSSKGKFYSEIIVLIVVVLVSFFVFVFGGLRLVYITFTLNQLSPAMRINMGFIYSVIPITGILIILYSFDFFRNSLETFKKINNEE
ncbi:MAG: TRAP transporter small permease [Melioribacteraceae bacterium]|nr:TRAP transporter small permease [Melioribacteraceae bacterium]